mgnify:CR=1 FL=1
MNAQNSASNQTPPTRLRRYLDCDQCDHDFLRQNIEFIYYVRERAVADNAASVAGAEHDYDMLDFAIDTYERLLERTTDPLQRDAVTTALGALRNWRF